MSTAEVIKIEPKYLTLEGASRYCGLAKRTLEDHARAGDFESFVKCRRRLIKRESLDTWIESQPV